MIAAAFNSRLVNYRDRFCSIWDYKLCWIKSIISKYQIDVSTLSEEIFCYVVKANSSSTPYELVHYLYSQGLRIRNVRKGEGCDTSDESFMTVLNKYGIWGEQEAMKCMGLLLAAGGECMPYECIASYHRFEL